MADERPPVIQLRSPSGRLLGVLHAELMQLAVKRGDMLYTVDLGATLREGRAVVRETVLVRVLGEDRDGAVE